MRKIVSYMFTTVDAFIAGPAGEFDAFEPSDEEMRFANELFASADGIMFGRNVYESFCPYWDTLDLADPSIPENDKAFARIFKNMKRVVFSRTLDAVPAGDILIRDDIERQVDALKQAPGRDFLLICGPELFATLAGLGQIDEFRLLIRPHARGQGMPLFGHLREQLPLRLIDTRTFASGVVMHHYAAGAETA